MKSRRAPVLPVDATTRNVSAPLGLLRGERELVERVRGGDEAAFEEMFRAFVRELWVFAVGYVGSPEVAEELVQDVFARVWAGRATWDVRDGVRKYLFGAVRNGALRHLGHERIVARWAERAAGDRGAAGVGTGPRPTDDGAQRAELADALRRAVARLPERRRQAYLLRWQRGMSNAAIAQAMGISVKGVEMALVQALKALREELSGLL